MCHRWWTPDKPRMVQTLTDAQADSILNDLTTVLTRNDGPGDVACKVAVGAFTESDGNLNANAAGQQVVNLAGNVTVVPRVDFCGSAGFDTSITGCGQTPGASFITERFTASQEGNLWAHEFGHDTGLPLDIAARDAPADALLALLNDPAEILHHGNTAKVIGMIGDPASTAALIDHVEQGPSGEGVAEGIAPEGGVVGYYRNR